MPDQTPTETQPRYHNRILNFIATWRSFPAYEMLSYLFMYAGAVMFAYGIHRYTPQTYLILILAMATMYAGFFAAVIWNDITDQDIDAVVHPNRPIPGSRISPRRFFAIALVFSAMTFLFALLVSPWCFILVGTAALFVAVHNKYLKKIVKFPAYSEIFTPVQWIVVPLFGFFAVWSALPTCVDFTITAPLLGSLSIARADLLPMALLVLFTYFTDDAHDLAEGIHDADGDRRTGVRTYATSFGPRVAAAVSFSMFLLSGILGILLYLYSLLTLVFLLPFLAFWGYTLFFSIQLLREKDPQQQKDIGTIVGRKGYNLLLVSYVLIFVDVLIQLLLSTPRGC